MRKNLLFQKSAKQSIVDMELTAHYTLANKIKYAQWLIPHLVTHTVNILFSRGMIFIMCHRSAY